MLKRAGLPVVGGAVLAAVAIAALVFLLISLKASPQQLTAASQGTSVASASAATGTAGGPAKGTPVTHGSGNSPTAGEAAAPGTASGPSQAVPEPAKTVVKTETRQVNGKTVTVEVTVTATPVVTQSAAAAVTAAPSAPAASGAPATAGAAPSPSNAAPSGEGAVKHGGNNSAVAAGDETETPAATPAASATDTATSPVEVEGTPCTSADIGIVAHTANGEALICVVGVWVSVDNPNLPENGQSCAGYALGAESTAAGNGKELVCTAVEPAPGFQTWLYAS